AALLENKSSGCAWNGGTVVDVVEPASGQTYQVKFDRPNVVELLVKVTTSNGNAANITQAVLDYAAGLINGLEGFVVGSDASPFEIAGAIMSEYPGYFISKVELSLTSPVSYSTDVIPIAVDEIARTQLSYITVVIA
ncbi:baseplate J/gp47 family protein, partial [Singulisphaera rosea]